MHIKSLVVAVVVLGGALACGPGNDKKATGSGCDEDEDCSGGACYEATCYATCSGQLDCAADEVCVRKQAADRHVNICAPASDAALAEPCSDDQTCAELLPSPAPCRRALCDGTCTIRPEDEGATCEVHGGAAGTCHDGRCVCGEACGTTVDVEGGTLQMGCDEAVDSACADDEGPVHAVEVPSFHMDRTEVTVGAWQACVNSHGCLEPYEDATCTYWMERAGNLPVTCVNHVQAERFCLWVGRRLCTEAEWELAARGREGRRFPWGGDAPTCDLAVFDPTADGGASDGQPCSADGPADVGSRPAGATADGLQDLAGNVWEWVADEYQPSYSGAPVDGSARLPELSMDDTPFAVRGGSWKHGTSLLRGTARWSLARKSGHVAVGLRCCADR